MESHETTERDKPQACSRPPTAEEREAPLSLAGEANVSVPTPTVPPAAKKHKTGLWTRLKKVGQNLYRHKETDVYYARKAIDGRTRLETLETNDPQMAKRKLADWLGDAERVNPTATRSSLEDLLKQFEATRADCDADTRTAEAGFAKSVRAKFDCGRRVSSVKPSELKVFVNKLAQEREYSANTYNRLCLFVRQLFELARSDGMTADNLYTFSGLRYKTVHRSPPCIPTSEQFEKILAEVRATKKNRKAMCSADFLEFEGRAGLGQAEASELRWREVDFSAGPLLSDGGTRAGEMQVKRVKTGKYFVVPIFPKLRPLLERLRAEALERAEKDGRTFDPEERVFVIDNARKALTNACERLGFPEFTQRNLRQMFIVELYRAGVDVKTIAEWQGHQDGGKLIMDTYTEVFGADKQRYTSMQLAKLGC